MTDTTTADSIYTLTITLAVAGGAYISHMGGSNPEILAPAAAAFASIYAVENYDMSDLLDRATPNKPQDDDDTETLELNDPNEADS